MAKIFRIWRNGYSKGISARERLWSLLFFWFLVFNNIHPAFSAGFLDERSFNQRSLAGRVNIFLGMYFLWELECLSFWYLFNWSLERILGGIPASIVYALVAAVPAVRVHYQTPWFTTMNSVIAVAWQIGVQFFFPVRDTVSRFRTRYQMTKHRRASGNCLDFDNRVRLELVSQEEYAAARADPGAFVSMKHVPLKVRAERYIKFTNTFQTGRSMEYMVGLHKDYLEGSINVMEDYNKSAPKHLRCKKGHKEPFFEKFVFVLVTKTIFAYSSYSFFSQPYTFITVLAYGVVCAIKQTIIAFKRYQSARRTRRQFTNMVASNIWAMGLVSAPVTVDKDILDPAENMIAFTLAMAFAAFFLTEPIAPLLQNLNELLVRAFAKLGRATRGALASLDRRTGGRLAKLGKLLRNGISRARDAWVV